MTFMEAVISLTTNHILPNLSARNFSPS